MNTESRDPPPETAEVTALRAQNRLLIAQNAALRAALAQSRDEIARLCAATDDAGPPPE